MRLVMQQRAQAASARRAMACASPGGRCRGDGLGQFGLAHCDEAVALSAASVPSDMRPVLAQAARAALCGTRVAERRMAGKLARARGELMRAWMLIAAVVGARCCWRRPCPRSNSRSAIRSTASSASLEIAPPPAEAARLAQAHGRCADGAAAAAPGRARRLSCSASRSGAIPCSSAKRRKPKRFCAIIWAPRAARSSSPPAARAQRTLSRREPRTISPPRSAISARRSIRTKICSWSSSPRTAARRHRRDPRTQPPVWRPAARASAATCSTQANIRNRVVIVSACFSGAFIAPLANDNTIVMTAAAPDRSSFGCQPQNNWTFFGDAYFNHSVREQRRHDRGIRRRQAPDRALGARTESLAAVEPADLRRPARAPRCCAKPSATRARLRDLLAISSSGAAVVRFGRAHDDARLHVGDEPKRQHLVAQEIVVSVHVAS